MAKQPTRKGGKSGAKTHSTLKCDLSALKELTRPELYDTIAAVARELRSVSLPEGLPVDCLDMLGTIQRHGPICLSDLSERVSLSLAATSRRALNLVDRGLVSKQRDVEDARLVLLSITARGSRTYTKATRLFFGHWTETIDGLNSERREVLRHFFGATCNNSN